MSRSLVANMAQCVRHLAAAVSSAGLYGAGHRQLQQSCLRAHELLQTAFGEEEPVSLIRVDDQLVVNGHPLPVTPISERFSRMLNGCGIGHVKFLSGIAVAELERMALALARHEESVRSSATLRFGLVEVRYGEGDLGRSEIAAASTYLEGGSGKDLARIMEVYEAVSRGRRLQVGGLTEIVAEFVSVFSHHADPLLALVPLRMMDEYTFTHSMNVCLLNLGQAMALGIDGPLLHDIGLAAMLHDIGKLLLPKEILNKPGKLDDREWAILKEHAVKGAEFLVNTPGVPRMAVANAYEHHMRYDRRGYPTVDGDWRQSLASQMSSVSDVYDALRTKRPYREPLPVGEVLAIIEPAAGTQLHPRLVENFCRLVRKIHPEVAAPAG